MKSLLPLVPVAVLVASIAALVIATRNSVRSPVQSSMPSSVERRPYPWLWRATAAVLWAGVLAQVGFMLSPSRIEPDGTLYEPLFWLLPVGWALLLVGTAATVTTVLTGTTSTVVRRRRLRPTS